MAYGKRAEDKCLRFAFLSDNATYPTKHTPLSAGFDLSSAHDVDIPAFGKGIVWTDIQIQLPQGTYGRIAPRSGISSRHFISVGAGVIDNDFRGNVGVLLFNHGHTEYRVKKGDRVAQLICEKIAYPEIMECPDLPPGRDASFGSNDNS